MDNIVISLNCVTPVFLAIACGYYIRIKKIIPEGFHSNLSSICFSVLLPLLLFRNAYTAEFGKTLSKGLITFLVCETICIFAAAYVVYSLIIKDHRTRGTAIQAAYRTNIAVVGVALAQNLMGQDGVAAMTIAIAVLLPLYNVLAVVTLETCRGEKVVLKAALLSIAKNPLIISTVLGLLLQFTGVKVPLAIDKGIESIGKAGSSLTLIALGMSFSFCNMKQAMSKLLIHSTIRLFAVPLVVLSVAIMLGFQKNDLGVILICCACPMATTVFPMAQEYHSDYELAGQLIVLTSLLCCFSMGLWIFLLKQVELL